MPCRIGKLDSFFCLFFLDLLAETCSILLHAMNLFSLYWPQAPGDCGFFPMD